MKTRICSLVMHKRPPGGSWTWILFNELLTVYGGNSGIYYIFPVVSPVQLHLISRVSIMGMNTVFSASIPNFNATETKNQAAYGNFTVYCKSLCLACKCTLSCFYEINKSGFSSLLGKGVKEVSLQKNMIQTFHIVRFRFFA